MSKRKVCQYLLVLIVVLLFIYWWSQSEILLDFAQSTADRYVKQNNYEEEFVDPDLSVSYKVIQYHGKYLIWVPCSYTIVYHSIANEERYLRIEVVPGLFPMFVQEENTKIVRV